MGAGSRGDGPVYMGLVAAGALCIVPVGAEPASAWQDLLSGMRASRVAVSRERSWLVTEGALGNGCDALLASALRPLGWSVVAATRNCASLAPVGETAWLASGHAPVIITQYDAWCSEVRRLPAPRYTDPAGIVGANRMRVLDPQTYVFGVAANEAYLWAWFMGGMVMVTRLSGNSDWLPHRYAAQFSEPYHWFEPGPGWAWHEWLVCAASPQEVSANEWMPGWPVRICVLSARNPAHGRRLQPPPQFAGYTIEAAALADDQVWVLGENEGRVGGFVGPQWALMTIRLPEFTWEAVPLPADFQQWERRRTNRRWFPMAVEGSSVVVGGTLGSAGTEGELVVLQLGEGRMVPLPRPGRRAVEVHDLALRDGTLWVAHDEGLSRIRLPE